ncbi:MAG: chemotaxis protein CheB [Prolixibacteraceae bacterium]
MKRAIVVGASYGGMEAIRNLLSGFPAGFDLPVIVVLHIGSNNIDAYIARLNEKTGFLVKEADEKEMIMPGTAYFAPPNYHLQIENDFSFSLSTDKKVNFSRPSIDVLFETAAWVFKEGLIGILLTGANNDGAQGLISVKKYDGTTIVENPETAVAPAMPRAATELFKPDYVLNLECITNKVIELCR